MANLRSMNSAAYEPYIPDLKEGSWDITSPVVFRVDGYGSEELKNLASSMNMARIRQHMINLSEHMVKEEDCLAVLWMQPRGTPNDTFQNLEWIPAHMTASGAKPEALTTFGAPWLLCGLEGSHRDNESLPFPGLGHLVRQLVGSIVAIVWPVELVTNRGPTIDQVHLFGRLDV